jgi:putative hydrolase of the HAD superfamily
MSDLLLYAIFFLLIAVIGWRLRQRRGRVGAAAVGSVYEMLNEEKRNAIEIHTLHADFWRRMGQCFQPFPEVLATLTQLRNAGVKVGIITNGTVHIQDAKINALGLRALLDVVVISEREGVRKPEIEIFNRALDRLGVAASEAWCVGDNPDVDVAGGAAAGLRSFWRECDDWPRPTVMCETIQSLDGLLPLLNGGLRCAT